MILIFVFYKDLQVYKDDLCLDKGHPCKYKPKDAGRRHRYYYCSIKKDNPWVVVMLTVATESRALVECSLRPVTEPCRNLLSTYTDKRVSNRPLHMSTTADRHPTGTRANQHPLLLRGNTPDKAGSPAAVWRHYQDVWGKQDGGPSRWPHTF